MQILGVDIGGTGIKAAPVNTVTGRLLKPRERIETPTPATPQAVARCVKQLAEHFEWKGPIGCAFPAVIKRGIVLTAANVDKSWIGKNIEQIIGSKCSRRIHAVNDADAAGIAEMRFGRGKRERGVVAMITLGTGIGSALFSAGQLVPNSELGHLIIRGKDAEKRASERARKKHDYSWNEWGEHVNEYLGLLESLLYPDLFIIGGGVSKEFKKFADQLQTKANVLPAKLLNDAGIVGAALSAEMRIKKP